MTRREFGSILHPSDRDGVYIVFTVKGERKKRKVPSEAVGKRKLAAIEERVLAGESLAKILRDVFGEATGHGMTFREAAALFLEYREPRIRASTFKQDVIRLRALLREAWTKKPLDAISPKDLASHGSRRMGGGRGVTGATVNREMSIVSALYRWAITMGFAERNPVRRLDKESEKGRARTVWLTDEESETLLASAHPEFAPALRCLLYAGLRRAELFTLEWRSVDFDNNWLVVEPEFSKTGIAREVRLTKALRRDLQALAASRRPGERHVFLRPRKRSPHSEGSLRHWFDAALAACPKESSIHSKRVTLHSLRHTFASYCAQMGAPVQDIAYLMGHLTVTVQQRYSHMVKGAGRRTIALLDQRVADHGASEVRELVDALAVA